MLHIRNVEEIENFLLLLPDLVRQQESGSAAFVENVDFWLNSLERVFEANRLYHAGNIAMLRSTMVAVKQGQMPRGIELRGRQSRSRLLKAVASEATQHGAEVASRVIEENRPRIEEATRIAQQIIAAALSRGLITKRGDRMDNNGYLIMIRRSLAAISELESAVVHLEGLVGPQDALVLLDRALAPHLNNGSLATQSLAVPSTG